MTDQNCLHIAMFPWFAMGHITPFLHLANKLAERGHKISFFLPSKLQQKLQAQNLHPNLLTLIPVSIPHVEGLPLGAETTADVPLSSVGLIMAAMDLTQKTVEESLSELKPHLVFFDFADWLPSIASKLGAKSIHCCIISSATIGYLLGWRVHRPGEKQLMETDIAMPPPDFPSLSIKLRAQEARAVAAGSNRPFGGGKSLHNRVWDSFCVCDAICFRSCREIEGPYCDYVEKLFRKPVILAGPVLPEPTTNNLDQEIDNWLKKFDAGSVIYCALGSECILETHQFMELVLGLEMMGMPFFAALKPPMGYEVIDSALPEGYAARIEGRGIVHGSWVNQQLILKHPSVGCFMTHCGSGSVMEGLLSECQLVLLPQSGDQFFNARIMDRELRVGVEVEKGEHDGLFTKEAVSNAVKAAMEGNSEVGREVRANHRKWREFLLGDELEKSCVDKLVHDLRGLLDGLSIA
ncbi:hypothetical protein Ancab_005345 [Ancistrocladus abbreviatus]